MTNNDDSAKAKPGFIKGIFLDWDHKDVRGLLFFLFGTANTIIILVAWLTPLFKHTVYIIADYSYIVSNQFNDNLYLMASADVSVFLISSLAKSLIIIVDMVLTASITVFFATRKTGKLLPENYKISVTGVVGMFFFYLVTVFISAVLATSVYVPANLSMNFHRVIDAISVVISEDEKKSLISQWAMMKSQSDYVHIVADVVNLSKK